MSALKEYHALMAAGHFKPASSITLSTPIPDVSTPQHSASAPHTSTSQPPTSAPRACTPQPPTQAPPAPPVGMYAPPRSTAILMTHQGYGPFPCATPLQHPPIYTPNSLTRDMISAHIQDLLQDKLPEFSAPNLVMLVTQLTNRIVHLGVNRQLGPNGLSGVHDIFMVTGHEGKGVYMGLAVMAPTALRILLRGQIAEFEGIEPMKDTGVMEWLRQDFFNSALDEWQMLKTGMKGNGTR
jgi:hypothetical protein